MLTEAFKIGNKLLFSIGIIKWLIKYKSEVILVAQRLYFVAKPSYQGLIIEKTIEFTYFAGQSQFQKQKSIDSMIYAIRAVESGGNILIKNTRKVFQLSMSSKALRFLRMTVHTEIFFLAHQ